MTALLKTFYKFLAYRPKCVACGSPVKISLKLSQYYTYNYDSVANAFVIDNTAHSDGFRGVPSTIPLKRANTLKVTNHATSPRVYAVCEKQGHKYQYVGYEMRLDKNGDMVNKALPRIFILSEWLHFSNLSGIEALYEAPGKTASINYFNTSNNSKLVIAADISFNDITPETMDYYRAKIDKLTILA